MYEFDGIEIWIGRVDFGVVVCKVIKVIKVGGFVQGEGEEYSNIVEKCMREFQGQRVRLEFGFVFLLGV